MFLKPISIQRANNIKVIDGSHPIGILGYIKGSGGRIKKLTIARSSFAPSLVPFRKAAQLCMENTRLQRVESAVVSFHLVIILAQLAMVPEHADFSSNVFVIRGNSTCFATGSEVLAWVKTESGGSSHRTDFLPTPFFPGKIFRAVCLAGVFNDREVESCGNFQDGVHVDGPA